MPHQVKGYCSTGECEATAGGGGSTLRLSASVGYPAVNQPADVLQVQNALNEIPPSEGGANPKLDPDGWYGKLTGAAILAFQQRQFGWSDGKIDVGGKTEIRMRELLSNPATDIARMTSININRPTAMRWIFQAKVWLDVAALRLQAQINGVLGNTTAGELAAVFRYFHLDRESPSAALGHIAFIRSTYDKMVTAAGRDSDMTRPGTGYFQLAAEGSESEKTLAFTYAGGFNMTKDGRPRLAHEANYSGLNLRTDAIYFFPERLQVEGPLGYAYAIIHELAHFVGGPMLSGIEVIDHSYFHKPLYNSLSPHWAVRTADAYARFAAHAANRGPILFKGVQ